MNLIDDIYKAGIYDEEISFDKNQKVVILSKIR